MDDLMSVKDVAIKLGRSTEWVRIRATHLNGVKRNGRWWFHPADVEDRGPVLCRTSAEPTWVQTVTFRCPNCKTEAQAERVKRQGFYPHDRSVRHMVVEQACLLCPDEVDGYGGDADVA